MRRPAPVKVYCYPVDRNGAYVPLLFEGIRDAFEPAYRQDGSLRDAIRELDAGRDVIAHVHWEEFVLRDCRSDAQADVAAAAFVAEIAEIRERDGALVWTVHNEWPHEIAYRRQFLAMRAALARNASAILLHDAAARDVLAAQVPFQPSRAHVLPHPSYIGRFESESALAAGSRESPERRIQAFGWIRRQKGYGDMIAMLPAEFLAARGARIRVSGNGPEATTVMAENAQRPDVEWDVRHVPDAEVPSLLRSAACVVLPYERVLTSGVALLAMSVGAVVAGVDLPPLRALLPVNGRRFLYPRGDADALRRIVDDVLALSQTERHRIVAANLAIARERRPAEIARRLAALYATVLRSTRATRVQ